jgi:ribonuclease R
MNLRDRLLQLLRRPDYVPLTGREIGAKLGLPKKELRTLESEIHALLGQGTVVRIKGDRLCLPKDADLVTGKIIFRPSGSALVVPETKANEPDKPAVQISAEETGVALHGDRVVVRLSGRLQRGRLRQGRMQPDEQTGRVIRILQRGRDTLTGNLQRTKLFHFVVPDDPRYPHDIYVSDPERSGVKPIPQVGDKVVVWLHEWTNRQANPEGEIIERLGRTHEPRAELAAIYHKYKLDMSFPDEVEREVAALPDHVHPREAQGRLDFRQIPTFTIDPDDAKDFDDALSIEHLANGELRVGIHIADVSAYVRTGTALDREAQRRGNSTYLVGAVVPMLPFKLSNGLCSLVEAQDRLTKAVLLTFDRRGQIKRSEYANTIIRSRKRLTYKQAYAFLKTDNLDEIRRLPLPAAHQTGSTGRALLDLSRGELLDLQTWIRELWSIAGRLRRERMQKGSLDLDMPETKIFVDEQGYADRLEIVTHDESHQLIEEFMLAANEAVARVTKQGQLPSLYRVHDDPEEEKLQELRGFLATAGVKVGDLTNRLEVVKLLQHLRDHPQGYMLRTQLLRSLKRACYRSSSDGHYGLAKTDYTHFTSPIRRYSDLAVHRVFEHHLIKNLGHPAHAGYAFAYNAAKMEALGEHLSLTEQNSMEAERESVKVKLVEFFEREVAKKKKTLFPAIITELRNHGMFIELTESMTFGLVHVSTLTDDLYVLNNAGTAFIGRRTKRKFELGQKLNVVADRVDRFKRQIDFRLAP